MNLLALLPESNQNLLRPQHHGPVSAAPKQPSPAQPCTCVVTTIVGTNLEQAYWMLDCSIMVCRICSRLALIQDYAWVVGTVFEPNILCGSASLVSNEPVTACVLKGLHSMHSIRIKYMSAREFKLFASLRLQ